jgi:hypothetical protein
MSQQQTLRMSEDAQAEVRFSSPQTGDQWAILWPYQPDSSAAISTSPLGFASYTAAIYSPVRELLREKAEVLGALQERRIRKLQDVLIEERLGKSRGKEALLRSCFSLYKEELMSMSEVMERTGMNRWEFFTYLDDNPEYQQIDVVDFLERVEED